MNARERLCQAIGEQQDRLRADVPGDRRAAILALIHAQERLPRLPSTETIPDLITGHRLADLCGNKALQLCFESTGDDVATPESSGDGLDLWGERFVAACGLLAEAELVLANCESGFMRMVEDDHGRFAAWIATKRVPTSWHERADFDWWAASLAKRHEPALRALQSDRTNRERRDLGDDAYYRRLSNVHLEMMGYQFGYPPDASIGGFPVQVYRDVLGLLMARALGERDRGVWVTPISEQALIAALASALAMHRAVIGQAVAAFTLDRENAAYHGAVPGIAAAPLVRVGPDRLVLSLHGLTAEPLLFLTHELTRRDAQGYHNAAYLRETVFRHDLYALFQHPRFVTSPGRVTLRRDDGDVCTDIDAVVFDRKTGTIGLFELKSQDPFARSPAGLARQRDSVLYANRQISGVLAWLKQHGPDALLQRVDPRTAKTFRVHKVHPFVLGRYLAHFSDGPEPERRAAWGTWPQVLRLLDEQPIPATHANPIAALSARLTKDTPHVHLPAGLPPREIAIGDVQLTVHPSCSALHANTATRRGSSSCHTA